MISAATDSDRTSTGPRAAARARAAHFVFGQLYPLTTGGGWRVLMIALLLVGGTVISLARTPVHVWNVLWAEDGPVFVAGALDQGAAAIFQGYAGYLHLVARLGAAVAVLFPLEIVPIAVTIISAAITSAIACTCFLLIEQRISSVSLRLAAWVVCLALPIAGGEVANNLANLHWFLLIAAFLATVVRVERTSMIVVQSAVLFVAVTSDALALMLLPLVVTRIVLLRGRSRLIPEVAYIVGAVLQLTVVIAQIVDGAAREVSAVRPTMDQLIDTYVYRVVLSGVFGTTGPARIIEIVGLALPGLVLAAVIATVIAAACADRSRRVLIGALSIGSVAFSAVVFTVQWRGFVNVPLLEFFTGARYAAVPTALLMLALIVSVDVGVGRLRWPAARSTVAGLALVAVLIPVLTDFRPMNIRSDGASWPDQVELAQDVCSDAPADESVNLAVSPAWFGGMVLSCAAVQERD